MSGSQTFYADELRRGKVQPQIDRILKQTAQEMLDKMRAAIADPDRHLVAIQASGGGLASLACRLAPALHYLVVDFDESRIYGWGRPGVGFAVSPQALAAAEREGGINRLISRLAMAYAGILMTSGMGFQVPTVVFLVGLDRALELPGATAQNLAALEPADLAPVSKVVVLVASEAARNSLVSACEKGARDGTPR